MKLVFDIETDGLLPTVSRIHCICAKDVDTEQEYSFYGETIEDGLAFLACAEELIGHNIVGYDLPALKKLAGFTYSGNVLDTLVLSRIIYPEIKEQDFQLRAYQEKRGLALFNQVGSHSLGAWGKRIGTYKEDFNKDFSIFTQTMLEYCQQDVRVTYELYKKFLDKLPPQSCIELEQEMSRLCLEMELHGWPFNLEAAKKLYEEVRVKRDSIVTQLRAIFPGWEEEMKCPAYYTYQYEGLSFRSVSKGSVEDEAYLSLKASYGKAITRKLIQEGIQDGPVRKRKVQFKPGSGKHIERAFKEKYGWKPTSFNKDGSAQVNEEILEGLEYPECKLLLEYELLQDRCEKLKEGRNGGWIDYASADGRIHGHIISNGAVTCRATHNRPNVAQVPSNDKPYGRQCRELFTTVPGYVLLGSDADSLELRCLAHYLSWHDGGEYAKIVSLGKKEDLTDVHSVNQRAANLASRDNAKTFIYGFLYGAGEEKVGRIVGVSLQEIEIYRVTRKKEWESLKRQRKKRGLPDDAYSIALCLRGRDLIQEFLSNTPALKVLREKVKERVREQGYLTSLDGRKLHIRYEHAALNTLLQSAGSIVCKTWMVECHKLIKERNVDAIQVGWIHDEKQWVVRIGQEDDMKRICEDAIKSAEQILNFRCPLSCGVSIGEDWSKTH